MKGLPLARSIPIVVVVAPAPGVETSSPARLPASPSKMTLTLPSSSSSSIRLDCMTSSATIPPTLRSCPERSPPQPPPPPTWLRGPLGALLGASGGRALSSLHGHHLIGSRTRSFYASSSVMCRVKDSQLWVHACLIHRTSWKVRSLKSAACMAPVRTYGRRNPPHTTVT